MRVLFLTIFCIINISFLLKSDLFLLYFCIIFEVRHFFFVFQLGHRLILQSLKSFLIFFLAFWLFFICIIVYYLLPTKVIFFPWLVTFNTFWLYFFWCNIICDDFYVAVVSLQSVNAKLLILPLFPVHVHFLFSQYKIS